jgi:hypothetical protein
MQNNFAEQEKINELMPNESCIPCGTGNSDMLRKEHNRWKDEVKKRQDSQGKVTSYWQGVSSCVAL